MFWNYHLYLIYLIIRHSVVVLKSLSRNELFKIVFNLEKSVFQCVHSSPSHPTKSQGTRKFCKTKFSDKLQEWTNAWIDLLLVIRKLCALAHIGGYFLVFKHLQCLHRNCILIIKLNRSYNFDLLTVQIDENQWW